MTSASLCNAYEVARQVSRLLRHGMGHLVAGQPSHSTVRAARSRRAWSAVVMKHRKAADVLYPQRTSPRAPCPPSNPPRAVYAENAEALTSKVKPSPVPAARSSRACRKRSGSTAPSMRPPAPAPPCPPLPPSAHLCPPLRSPC